MGCQSESRRIEKHRAATGDSGCHGLTFVKWYKRNRAKTTFQLDENISSNEPAERSADLIDAGTAITFLKTLSDEKQEIVRLRIWGELKFSEIAEELNKSEVAVKKMFYRTLSEIKDKLE